MAWSIPFVRRGHWKYGPKPDPEKYFGFVYLITDTVNGMYYIGRKQYKFKRRKRYVDSDWRTYTSSSKRLNEAISKHGKRNFKFRILSQHTSRSSLRYAEIKEIVKSDAFIRNNFYNGDIPSMRGRVAPITPDLGECRSCNYTGCT